MLFDKTTYQIIAFGFLVIFISLLAVPSFIVAAIDEDADISMVYSFAEEETKENEVKGKANVDDFYPSNTFLPERVIVELITAQFNYVNYLTTTHYLGIIVPPPELS